MTYLLNHFATKTKKTVKTVTSQGPRGMMTRMGQGPAKSVSEKWPGTSGNGFLGFPLASLYLIETQKGAIISQALLHNLNGRGMVSVGDILWYKFGRRRLSIPFNYLP